MRDKAHVHLPKLARSLKPSLLLRRLSVIGLVVTAACSGGRELLGPDASVATSPSTDAGNGAPPPTQTDAGSNQTHTYPDGALFDEDASMPTTTSDESTNLLDSSFALDAATHVSTSTESSFGVVHDASAPISGSDAADQTSINATSSEPTVTSVPTCDLTPAVALSPAIGTVGILTLTTSLTDIQKGRVEFGPDTEYALSAPLDLSAADYRTLLLGMTQGTTYHYRVVVETEHGVCTSTDDSFTTDLAPAAVPRPQVSTPLPSQVAPGFVVTSAFAGPGGSAYTLIYNHHGELVWWTPSSIGAISRARLSWDGKYMYSRDANPTGASGAGRVVRVSMDGTRAEPIHVDSGHHDMTVTPYNGVLFLTGAGRDDCSTITNLAPNGEVSLFYDLRDAFQGPFRQAAVDPCHCNSIDYNMADRSITVSCLGQNAYVKLTEEGTLLWVLGGNNGQSDFTGDVHWQRQHGHHFTSPSRVVFYNNNGGGDSEATTSIAVELELDLVNHTATRVWEYIGGEKSVTFGDVQRLPNGNTLVTYSNAATIREVTPQRSEVQTWVFPAGIGYSEHLTSLYGGAVQP